MGKDRLFDIITNMERCSRSLVVNSNLPGQEHSIVIIKCAFSQKCMLIALGNMMERSLQQGNQCFQTGICLDFLNSWEISIPTP